MNRKAVTVAIALVLFTAGFTEAQTLSGRLVTSVYTWQRQATDSTSVDHVRANQVAILKVDGLGHPNISFHTNFRGQGNWSGDLVDSNQFRLFQLYGQWNDRARGTTARVGRQRLYMGPANLAVDGAWLRQRFLERWHAEGFIGVQPPLDRRGDLIKAWDSNRAFGGRVMTDQMDGRLTASFSAYRTDRRHELYAEPGEHTGEVLILPTEEEEVYGYDLAYRARPGLDFYHEFEYERLRDLLKFVNAAVQVAPPGAAWNLDGEFFQRAPSLTRNSILWVFNHGDYREFSLRGGYRTSPDLRLFGGWGYLDVEDDDANRVTAGATYRQLTGTYTYRTGYTGDSNAVVASYAWPVHSMVLLDFATGFTHYKLSEVQDESDWSWTIAGNVQTRLRRNLTVDLQVLNLSQDFKGRPDFAGMTHDVRGYLKIAYWFSAGAKTRSVF